jgi:hypothetical protein
LLKDKDDTTHEPKIENNIKLVNRNDDELETPEDDFLYIVGFVKKHLDIGPPDLDCFATQQNSKCIDCLTKEADAFHSDWLRSDGKKPRCWWLNGPHSLHPEYIKRLHEQFKEFKIPAIIIIPSRTRRTKYWKRMIEHFRFGSSPEFKDVQKFIHNWPYTKNISFLKNGKPVTTRDGKISHAGNAYEILVFDPRLVTDWNYEYRTLEEQDFEENQTTLFD